MKNVVSSLRGFRRARTSLKAQLNTAISGIAEQRRLYPQILAASAAMMGVAYGGAEGPEADDGQWVMPQKTYTATRYSGLQEINANTVTNLKVAWTFSTGVNRGQEAAPLVVSNVMYVVTPYPNILYALDLKQSGALKWKFEPEPDASAQGVACCDLVNRGCVYDDGKIFYNTLDCHTVAVDAR